MVAPCQAKWLSARTTDAFGPDVRTALGLRTFTPGSGCFPLMTDTTWGRPEHHELRRQHRRRSSNGTPSGALVWLGSSARSVLLTVSLDLTARCTEPPSHRLGCHLPSFGFLSYQAIWLWRYWKYVNMVLVSRLHALTEVDELGLGVTSWAVRLAAHAPVCMALGVTGPTTADVSRQPCRARSMSTKEFGSCMSSSFSVWLRWSR